MPERLMAVTPVPACVPSPAPLSGLAPAAVPGVAALSLASCRGRADAPPPPAARTATPALSATGPPSGFFTGRRPGRPGLAVFVNAGDPPLEMLPELAAMLDESDVD